MPPWLDASSADNDQPVQRNFADWLQASRAKGTDGNPLTLFHGTPAAFDAFSTHHLGAHSEHPSAQLGFFFTSEREVAKIWSSPENGTILEVYLAIQNPLVIHGETFRAIVDEDRLYQDIRKDVEHILEIAAQNGHDGIHVRAISGAKNDSDIEWSTDTWIAFRADQVKALNNCGLFLSGNASMTDQDARQKLLQAKRAAGLADEAAREKLIP